MIEGPRSAAVAASVALAGGAVALALALVLPQSVAAVLVPLWATLLVFVTFFAVLTLRVGANVFGEIGLLYLGLVTAYTVLPGVGFLVAGGVAEDNALLAQLLPDPERLGAHLWRHALFMFTVAVGYLLGRGRENPGLISIPDPERKDGRTFALVVALIAVCLLSLTLLSAPVHSYIDHYVRYDHLPWLVRKFVSLCVRLKLGLYIVLITFLFLNHRRYWLVIPFVVAGICVQELTYTRGSRIDTLIILLAAACLYSFTVKPITLKMAAMAFLAMIVLFTAVEIIRLDDGPSEVELKPASEFMAVYFTSYHLYAERAEGTLPPVEWPMFFNDFISLVTFSEFSRWNPQEWYAREYFPDAIVAPQTLGPIADSAIWGGEPDLAARGLINGLFFAYIVRWFLKRRDRWWAIVVYVYCVSTCVLTLKYSIFYHLVPLLKTILPTLLLIGALRNRFPPGEDAGSDLSAEPSRS